MPDCMEGSTTRRPWVLVNFTYGSIAACWPIGDFSTWVGLAGVGDSFQSMRTGNAGPVGITLGTACRRIGYDGEAQHPLLGTCEPADR